MSWVLTSETSNSMNHSWKWGNKSFMIEKHGRKIQVIEWKTVSSNQTFHWLRWNPGLGLQDDVSSKTDIKMVCQESDMHMTVTSLSTSCHKATAKSNSTNKKSKIRFSSLWSPTIHETKIKNILCYTTRDVNDFASRLSHFMAFTIAVSCIYTVIKGASLPARKCLQKHEWDPIALWE